MEAEVEAEAEDKTKDKTKDEVQAAKIPSEEEEVENKEDLANNAEIADENNTPEQPPK